MSRQEPAIARKGTPVDDETSKIPESVARTPEMQAFALALSERIEFSQRLRELRKALGLTQSEVGEIIGEQQSEVSRMERGEANPSIARANQAFEKLGNFATARNSNASAIPETEVTACRVADYLLAEQDPDDRITNLKLQKLLYYAQGYALALLGRPVFPERILAWDLGPVVAEVYAKYRNGAEPIRRLDRFDPTTLDAETRELLDHVYAKFGQYEAWRLKEMTHAEPPWKETPRNSEITQEQLEAHFRQALGR